MAVIAPYADVHKDPQGPGDARPTALQVVKDAGLVGKMKDKGKSWKPFTQYRLCLTLFF